MTRGFWRQLLAALAREESDLEDDAAEPRQRLADAVQRAGAEDLGPCMHCDHGDRRVKCICDQTARGAG